ncbi:protein rep [Paenibacillus sp. 453mf]|uniref:protein rep n=1 Tax=Paenibacillus sp. 453mf TaxID=1761874 RepID=UPI0008EC7F4E|nr:protein rep [Paenibacillus sp. 453mf]SFT00837.1 hypothetical protein SAMN04488601_1212 [Paenibacillus sp. 453mf]
MERGSALVYMTKFASAFSEVKTHEPNKGKGSELVKKGQTLDLEEHLKKTRAERYMLQAIARKALPNERVMKCLRHRRSKDIDVEVWKHSGTSKAFYAGLQVCGSVWNCPVCAAKISERRRSELKEALFKHKKVGGRVAMLTLTFSHKKTDKLHDTLQRFLDAVRKFRSGRPYKNTIEPLGMIGSIRAFEITYGQNGFHPHVHILLFYNNAVIMPLIEAQLFRLWKEACTKLGLTTKDGYGLTLQDGGMADNYVTKWGIDQEMTKSHVKKGRQDSLTPFDFLRSYLESEDEKYLYLYSEYASALKGKSQLFWSKGLKQHFMLEEKTDEELAEEKTELADLLGTLRYYDWQKIMYSDKRAEFLELCENNNFEDALKIILPLTSGKRKNATDATVTLDSPDKITKSTDSPGNGV